MSETPRTRRDELLQAAAHLFARKGYHATSMQDIAEALDILRGSLYHHIESKEALLLELMERGVRGLLEEVLPVAEQDWPPEQKLAEIIRRTTTAIAEHADFMAVFLHEMKSVPPERRGPIDALRLQYEGLIRQVLEEGMQTGVFRPVDTQIALFGLLGMVSWTYRWYNPQGRLTPQEIGDIFVDMLLGGLLTNPEERTRLLASREQKA